MWICENCGAENSDLTAKCDECGDINLEKLEAYLESEE